MGQNCYMSETPSVPDDPELLGKDWWHALRQIYEVAPIVKDRNALTHIAQSFPYPQNFVSMSDDLALTLGKIAILGLVDAGEAGSLDRMVLAEQEPRRDTFIDAVKPFVAHYVQGMGFQDEVFKNSRAVFERMRPRLLFESA
jgi:hypothetical protein